MPITLNGNWRITPLGSEALYQQRFVVAGASSGNGEYINISTDFVDVIGTAWTFQIQHNDGTGWKNSAMQSTQPQIQGNQKIFFIDSEDFGGDEDYNDFSVKFTQPYIEPPIIVPPVVIPPAQPPIIPPVIPPPIPPPISEEIGVGKIYTKFEADEFSPVLKQQKIYGLWPNLIKNQITFHTSSLQNEISASKTILNGLGCDSVKLFDISYGNINGSGSKDLGGKDLYSVTNAIYTQYANLCNDGQPFYLGNKKIEHFYAINISKKILLDELDLGLNEINLHHLSGSVPNNVHTGSNVKLSPIRKITSLIDDSRLNSESVENSYFYGTKQPNITYLVSGSIENGVYNSTNPNVFGLVYNKQGVYIIDADALDTSSSFLTVTGSDIYGDNSMKLFTAISGAALFTDNSGDYLGFKARKFINEYRQQFFVRIKNRDYNFSNNKTWFSGSEQLVPSEFYHNPKVYISEVGLYDENYELMAVGKINNPKQKNYTTEANFKVTVKY